MKRSPSKVQFVNLKFVLRGRGKALTALCILALVGAVAETLLLAAVVQAISVMSEGNAELLLRVGNWKLHSSVGFVLIAAVVAAVVRGVCTAVVAIAGPVIAAHGRERQRRELLSSFLWSSWATQSADRAGRFLQVFISSVNEANTPVLLLTQGVPALITALVLVGAAMTLNLWLTTLICVIGLTIGLLVRPIARLATQAARDDTLAREDTASHVSGVIAAGAEIATMGARGGALEVANQRILRAEHFFAMAAGRTRLMGTMSQSLAFLLAAVGLLALNVTGKNVDYTVVGTIAVLLLRVAGLAQQVQSTTSIYRALAPFIDQVRELTEHYQHRRQMFGQRPFPRAFTVRLSNVSYRYPGMAKPALIVREATIHENQFIAVVGPSGSGKSTFIQLVLRLRAPDEGTITIGSEHLVDLSEAGFTTQVSYVPQAPHLVPGSILENIVFFRPHVSEDQAVEAAKRAHVHHEILSLPDGYQTRLDAHVDQLSGGQKQRLALARALATAPRLLVLDEPTSALDVANESLVLSMLQALRATTTVIMVTHKTAAVAACDAVFEVSDGVMREVNLTQFLARRT